jgi:NAD(P) transhydrogenase subunit alpha
MVIGLLKEPAYETRVSLLPEHLSILQKLQLKVLVEATAGLNAYATDEQYLASGAEIKSREVIFEQADLLLCLNPLSGEELKKCTGKVLLGFYQVMNQKTLLPEWAASGASIFSLDMLPRTTRAQSMDVLSSQANIAGYKAVILAAELSPRYFPMFMTAAGSIPPAKVLILGAGVAGLQAIATAKRLGSVVEVFDTRPAVKEEVMSLGAKFVEVEGAADASKAGGYAVEQTEAFLQKQKARIAESVAKADIIITTAQIPGKKAPLLITDAMLDVMRIGSVVIDLAAATGGNTEHTKPDETVIYKGVRIVGNSRLPSTLPADASKLYGKNILNFLQLIITKEGQLNLNLEDDLVKGTLITHSGAIVHEQLK